jgi:hypothetical protein
MDINEKYLLQIKRILINKMSETEKGGIEKGVVEIRDLEIKDMHNWVLCPISYCIFKNPVIAEDGYIYEHDCIYQWFMNCRDNCMGIVSPLTKESLPSSKLVSCQMARQMVDTYLFLFPDKKLNQYVCEFEMKTLMHYLYHSVPIGENYIRSIESISLQDITFHQMQKCVKIMNNRNDPLLRVSLWETFFKKIEDIHESFKNEKRESASFSFEEEDMENISINTLEHDNNEPEPEQGIDIPSFSENAGVLEVPVLQRNENISEEEIETVITAFTQLSIEETPTPIFHNPLTIQMEETEIEEGEIVEENRVIPPILSRLKNTKSRHHYSYKRSLIGCLCFHANKRILEVFLNCMPKITCPKITKRYSHLIEDFIKNQDLMGNIRVMEYEEITRLQDILILMLEKGIPYHGWTRNGKQPILAMLYFTLDHFYPMFAKIQKKIVEIPEFFVFPPGASSGSMTQNELLRMTLSESTSFHMSLHVWNIYQKNNILLLEDIWEFCVKYSEHNIWIEKNWTKTQLYEELLFDFVKKRGSIPMNLVLIKAFSSRLITHCFIEGYRIEDSEKMYSFPQHESIIAPIIQEDTISKKMKNNKPFCPYENRVHSEIVNNKTNSKNWKVNKNTPGGRLQISRRNLSTEWSWNKTIDNDCTIQPSPIMSVLGWLIYHYQSPIVLLYLENHTNLVIDMNSKEFTGVEYVQPIHLVFRYHEECVKTEELLSEMMKRGASLTNKTSHDWLPIHYACRYSPKLIEWVIENITDKKTYLNEPLYFRPSSQALKTMEHQNDWYQTYSPLEIFMMNYSIHNINAVNKYNMNLLISSGAIKKEFVNEYHQNTPFIVEEPITFEIGSYIGNGIQYSNKKRNRSSSKKITRTDSDVSDISSI